MIDFESQGEKILLPRYRNLDPSRDKNTVKVPDIDTFDNMVVCEDSIRKVLLKAKNDACETAKSLGINTTNSTLTKS